MLHSRVREQAVPRGRLCHVFTFAFNTHTHTHTHTLSHTRTHAYTHAHTHTSTHTHTHTHTHTRAPLSCARAGRAAGTPTPRVVTADGVIYSKSVTSLSQLRYDDGLAAEEAAAAGGRPGYCGDRALRAMAGGQYCKQFDR